MSYPIPDSIALAHSEALTQKIREAIEASQGAISFARFMALALYAPGLGYYSAGAQKFGKEGDFITAPEISPLFAECIARQCQSIFLESEENNFLEIGAGSGIFAKDLLFALEKLDALPKNYFILEVSAELRARQEQFLKTHCASFFSRIIWLSTLPEEFSGVVFANEVLDAMPAHCFQIENNKIIQERCVTFENNYFDWILKPPSLELENAIKNLSLSFPQDKIYQSEINLMHSAWIKSLSAILKSGLILLFDYGYGRNEFYHPDRTHGTLMCFYQHHKHTNPFLYVGLQDITAHVDFTTLAESATASDLFLAGFTTQAGFLLACDLLAIADTENLSEIERYKKNQAIKTLTLPSQMGEIIKVMALTKNINTQPLLGFTWQDRRRDL